jgi:hypothetical protein
LLIELRLIGNWVLSVGHWTFLAIRKISNIQRRTTNSQMKTWKLNIEHLMQFHSCLIINRIEQNAAITVWSPFSKAGLLDSLEKHEKY